MKAFAGFTRVENMATAGGAILFDMPDVTHKAVQRAFGTSLSNQRREKYSSALYVKHNDTGFVYRLYMSFGVWRVGYEAGMRENATYVALANILRDELENVSSVAN